MNLPCRAGFSPPRRISTGFVPLGAPVAKAEKFVSRLKAGSGLKPAPLRKAKLQGWASAPPSPPQRRDVHA
jgi:hypothetical protein